MSHKQPIGSPTSYSFSSGCSKWLPNLLSTTADIFVSTAEHSNTQRVYDSKFEARHEEYDRVWRRWAYYCERFYLFPDPSLAGIYPREVRLIAQVFFKIYRESNFNAKSGEVVGKRAKPMVGRFICKTAGTLATMFQDRYQWHPFHEGYQKEATFWSNLNNVFKGKENISQRVKRQKAVTPQLLHYLASFSSRKIINNPEEHATDLMINKYFFLMRSCEFAKPAKKGKTKVIRLGGVKFLTKNYQVINHNDPGLLRRAAFVWVLFEAQRNSEKCKARTQERSGDTKLCPV